MTFVIKKYKTKANEIALTINPCCASLLFIASTMKSEKKFRKFFENSIGLMSLRDLEGNLLAVNEEGRKSLLYTKEEVQNLNLFQLVNPEDKLLMEEYLIRIQKEKRDKGLMVLNAKDGSKVYWMYHNMLEVDDQGKLYVVSTALNITERILLEKKYKLKSNGYIPSKRK